MPNPVVRTQSYGKSQVRVSRVSREAEVHHIEELLLTVELEGDFDAAYLAADNASIVPTDTIKNTVYVLASRHGIESIESFCSRLAEHFLNTYPQVELAIARGERVVRQRLEFNGQPHPHAFVKLAERHTCEAVATDDAVTLTAGLRGLEVLKTTGSGFEDFHTDAYTTLRPTSDRLLATSIDAQWPCRNASTDWTAARQAIRHALLDVFANTHSPSVQRTLYAMGQRALEVCEAIDTIHLALPNQHHLLVNLEPFGLSNPNEVFVPTSEPFGNITATIARADADFAGDRP